MASKTPASMPARQPSLLRQRRFLPFFCTQFLGAFNDNLFKNALLLIIAFQTLALSSTDPDVLTNLAQALFILPFFLFSAFAGQVADKLEKASLIRTLKLTELAIMGAAAGALYYQSLNGLIAVLFLMGMQSAFFGPVKYSIIPQHLHETELVAGNALVETGTFLAILLGTAGAGLVMQLPGGTGWLAGLLLLIALLGYGSSRSIPLTPAQDPGLVLDFNPAKTTLDTLRYAYARRTLFLSILGISWFWFLGASYLTQLPNYTVEALGARESVVTLLLCLFSIGIGAGSMLCDRLSGRRIEIGIVPLGSLGLSIFGIDLYYASQLPPAELPRTLMQFLDLEGAWRVVLDVGLVGVFGGFFIVPLYAMVQQRSEPAHRSRIIAANNILNALFMVVAALLGMLLLGPLGLTKAQYFLVLALLNIGVACYIYAQVPEFAMRFLVWLLGHTLYRVTHRDLDYIPERGPAVLVSNHVSYVDALLLGGAIRRPVRFVMLKAIFDIPVLNFVARTGGAIPIASKSTDPEAYERAFDQISEALGDGHLICIFPEGQLTRSGELNEFKSGIEKIIARDPVPVIPMALRGLWGSFFSHKDGGAFRGRPKNLSPRVEVVAGEPIAPQNVSAAYLYEQVLALRGPAC